MAGPNGRKPPNPNQVPKQHGRKPSSPATAPKQHGRKPPAPPAHDGDGCVLDLVAAVALVVALLVAIL
jgi:hypothetical protein